MKRIVYAVLATISGLVLLFSYRTSLEAVSPQAAPAAQETDASTSTPDADQGSSGSDDPSESAESSDTGSSDTGSSDTGSSDTESSGTGASDASGAPSGSAATTGLADGTYTGSSADTRFGPVQVQITVSGGRITAAQAVDYPNENRHDQQINQFAIPQLVSETLSAQSADIDMISGATYTSDGYLRSLQSAIDQATS